MRKGLTHSESGKLGWIASKKTREKKREEKISQYNNSPSVCQECGHTIPYEKRHNKFCNNSCATTYNNKIAPKRRKKEKNCIQCGKSLSRGAAKYCSSECQHIYAWTQRKQTIEISGIEKSSKVAKKYLKEKYGVKCSICGIHKWMGQEVPLVLDHIDGDSNNNNIDNLRLVCGNCDMQLPTYKGKNIGRGRFARRQRYQNGKSY